MRIPVQQGGRVGTIALGAKRPAGYPILSRYDEWAHVFPNGLARRRHPEQPATGRPPRYQDIIGLKAYHVSQLRWPLNDCQSLEIEAMATASN